MPEIYGTLGPSCADKEMLQAMVEAGMTGMRLNLSHTTLEASAEMVDNLHRAAAACGRQVKLLIDMQGPELRIGALDRPLLLKPGETLILGAGGIPLPAMLLPFLCPGQQALLDDGKLLLEITAAETQCAHARVLRGGTLLGHKSISLPGCDLRPPTLTEADLQNIALAPSCGVTSLMQPFVRDRADLLAVRAALDAAGGQAIRLFAKVENREGVAHLDELLDACDEIVIARGDLGNAMPLWELPRVQKEIAAKCRAAGRGFMVVTQMLASMEHSAVPTRAEVSDIFNAVCDGAASVMVTGETAAGDYPVEAIRYLANTVREAERYLANTKNEL